MQLDEEKTVVIKDSFPVLSLLGAAMILLKLLGYIDISWWWVFAPFWFPIATVLGVLAFLALLAGGIAAFVHLTDKD